jgi:hypothetical protein
MTKTYQIKNRYWVSLGYSKGFGIGFRIDPYMLNIDLLWFWFSIEF